MTRAYASSATTPQQTKSVQSVAGPFNLRDQEAYLHWRERKLHGYPTATDQLRVEIDDPWRLTPNEKSRLTYLCRKTNMAVYACRKPPAQSKAAIRALGRQLGLRRLDHNLCADDDGIAVIQVVPTGRALEYIPYSERPINWHTDGYYNRYDEQVRGLIMHCVADAATGGGNALLDPEVVYVLMRDENPAYIAALMQPDAMTIPPNVNHGQELRPARAGPVFSVSAVDGSLHMRYTARTRSIHWKDDGVTAEAAKFLASVLGDTLPYVFNVRLAPGQGIICNNVLHTRKAFANDEVQGKKRVLLRARYYDRIASRESR